jgi:alkanesulfonate monooxygenase SsuD/methylene tetrahydromethanopterin reductase-like flavin-dependent oxidoreductase (luciferase family)
VSETVHPRTRWSVALPTLDPLGVGLRPTREAAQVAEELGFDTVWIGDHLFFRVPILESLTAASYVLGATTRLRVATGVLLPALRDPVVLAKQLSSISVLAAGRFMLGVGVGGEFDPEWRAVSVPVSQRGSRTDEFLDLWTAWINGAPLDHRGRHWTIDAPALEPRPEAESRPPLWVGGRGTAALSRAVARGAGWLGMLASPDRVRDVASELAQLTPEGRAVPEIGLILFVNVGDQEKARTELADYTQSNFAQPFDKLERWMVHGSDAQVSAALRDYRDAGVSHFVLHAATAEPTEQFARLRAIIDGLDSDD